MAGAIVALAGCGSDGTKPAEILDPVFCAAPEIALADGNCIRPGMSPEDCAEGFVHDGAYACEPIVPASPCPPGLMAIPGDESCREVMSCGSGKWGDLPIDADTQHVEAGFAGAPDGSATAPWPTIGEAIDAAAPGALVAVAAGDYPEAITITDKPVRLWGICPQQVTVAATSPSPVCPNTTLCVTTGADGSELGGMSIGGIGIGVLLSGSTAVRVERVRVHDNPESGIVAQDNFGPTSIEVLGSLVDDNDQLGLFFEGASALVDASMVRGTAGRGLNAQELSDVVVTRSMIDDSASYGAIALGATLQIDGSVVRGSGDGGVDARLLCAPTANGVQCDPNSRSSLTVRRSHLVHNQHGGLFAVGSDAFVEHTVVVASQPTATGALGLGLTAQPSCSLDLDLQIYVCNPATHAALQVTGSVIEANHGFGILARGASLALQSSLVRGTLPHGSDAQLGVGVAAQVACFPAPSGEVTCDPSKRASAVVVGSLVDDSHEVGIGIIGADAEIVDTVVRNTKATLGDGLFGDGISFVGDVDNVTTGSLANVRVDAAERAGISAFGAAVALADSWIDCAAFALNAEPLGVAQGEISDVGGNRCGCGDSAQACKVVTAGLMPPVPVEGALEP
jgi:Right handed beta helix region